MKTGVRDSLAGLARNDRLVDLQHRLSGPDNLLISYEMVLGRGKD